MRRAIAIGLLLAMLGACAAGLWATRSSMVAPLVLPGAVNVAVTSRSFSALRVAYQGPARANDWRGDIYQQLVANGWRGRDYTFGVTRQFTLTWYTRTFELGPLVILESAVVGGDPRDPSAINIEVHRELHLKE